MKDRTSSQAPQVDEQLCRRIVENSREAIVLVHGARIRYCNPRALELCGYSWEELRWLSWPRLIHPDDRKTVLHGGPAGEDAAASRTVRMYDREGRLKWLEIKLEAADWNGRSTVLAFASDITERKRLEQQFIQAQKMEAVGRLAGGVAHDFNNFLTVILGYAELLEGAAGQAAEAVENIRAIRATARKAAALTQGLLAFSRNQRLDPKTIDLNRLVDDIEPMLVRLMGESIAIVTKTAPGLGLVRADAARLEQVILNLAANAKDATEPGGTLFLATENVSVSGEALQPGSELRPGRYAMLSVTDTGSGMDERTMARLFEPFFTTKEKGRGTGLGLATVYGIVKQSGGFVHVYSEPGRGSTFKLYFPRIDEKPSREAGGGFAEEGPAGSETILVVEDDRGVLNIVESMLERKGFTVLKAGTGTEAVALSEASAEIDLVITDVGIPDMSGTEVWESVNSVHPESRVLFISGYPEDFAALRDFETDNRIFLEKPFGSETLLSRVRETLDYGKKRGC
jgi:two-component system cell cycle sensor histidine kinase/response regulator CckA